MQSRPAHLVLLFVAVAAASLAVAACEELGAGDLDTLGSDAADTTGGTDGSDDATAPGDLTDADDETDTAPDMVESGVLEPIFDPASTRFFDQPWPWDARRDGEGRLVLDGFPGSTNNELLEKYIAQLEQLHGFSVAPVVYLRFDGPLEQALLPSAAETLEDGAALQLVRVDADGCGERVPAVATWHERGDRYMPDTVVTVRPVPGFWLESGSTWAVVVTNSLGAGAGLTTATPPAFATLLANDPSFEPLRACAPQAGIALDALAVATVFTVQDATGELHAIRRQVLDPERTAAPQVLRWTHVPELDQPGIFRAYLADYQTPIYQEGESPYDTLGGFVFDDAGEPMVQRWETVPMTVLVPEPLPQGPRPVLVWIDGTGADQTRHLSRTVLHQALAQGFVVASFLPQMHEGRGAPGADPVLHSFNYFNPTSGRCVFRQQAIDTSYFVRVLREGFVGQDFEGLPELRTDRLVYGGHSQGAIVGALVAGIESEFAGYVLNGVGGWLSVTVEERLDPFDVAQTVATFFGLDREDVNIEHPIVHLAQTGADVVDPHSYARDWLGHPGHPAGTSVLMINGFLDHTTFPRSIDALTIRSDSDVLTPAGWEVDPYAVWTREPVAAPLEGNRLALDGTPRTLAEFLSATHGHFTLHEVPALQTMAVTFWQTALGEGAPRVELP